jgi:hypothetical protein
MVEQKVFDVAVEELAEYVENLKWKKGLSDQEVRDILDIVRQDYV